MIARGNTFAADLAGSILELCAVNDSLIRLRFKNHNMHGFRKAVMVPLMIYDGQYVDGRSGANLLNVLPERRSLKRGCSRSPALTKDSRRVSFAFPGF